MIIAARRKWSRCEQEEGRSRSGREGVVARESVNGGPVLVNLVSFTHVLPLLVVCLGIIVLGLTGLLLRLHKLDHAGDHPLERLVGLHERPDVVLEPFYPLIRGVAPQEAHLEAFGRPVEPLAASSSAAKQNERRALSPLRLGLCGLLLRALQRRLAHRSPHFFLGPRVRVHSPKEPAANGLEPPPRAPVLGEGVAQAFVQLQHVPPAIVGGALEEVLGDLLQLLVRVHAGVVRAEEVLAHDGDGHGQDGRDLAGLRPRDDVAVTHAGHGDDGEPEDVQEVLHQRRVSDLVDEHARAVGLSARLFRKALPRVAIALVLLAAVVHFPLEAFRAHLDMVQEHRGDQRDEEQERQWDSQLPYRILHRLVQDLRTPMVPQHLEDAERLEHLQNAGIGAVGA
eukprot:scaffold462_cov195-Pinguiococcus_pyrenoidosus.AAC.35